jgi:molybdopterin-guanine dinucleotide biosynthesis protein A
MRAHVLGAIIAGGASTRFGSPKALAVLGGRRIIDRAADALRAALEHDDVFAVINDDDLADNVTLPAITDVRFGAGALGGLHAALLHARERGAAGILAVSCDMPFVSAGLLRDLLQYAGADAALPESEGRRGVEPLCAWYATSCIEPIEAALGRGDARMIGFHSDIVMQRMPLAAVRAHGDPAVMFLNLNTPADLQRAQQYVEDGQ